MRPFNLDEYLKDPSRKIVTREGKPARIICTDAKSEKYQVVALVTKKGGQEVLATFDTSGKYRGGYNSLFFTLKMENTFSEKKILLTSSLPLKSTKGGLMCINQKVIGL